MDDRRRGPVGVALGCAVALGALMACNSGSTDDGGGTADAGTSFPHGWCPGYGPGTYPPGIGTTCATGSNKPTCASPDTSQCPDAGYCVWHAADIEGVKAYCTAPCKPGDPSSCPGGYTCEKEECGGLSVCVRTAQPPPAGDLKHRVEKGKPPLALVESGRLTGAVALSDGASYWSVRNGYILRRNADGTWLVVHKPKLVSKDHKAFSLRKLYAVGGAAYAYGAGGWLIRIAPGGAPRHEVLFNLENGSLPCDGADSGGTDKIDEGCSADRTWIAVVFRTESGEVRAVTGDPDAEAAQEVYRRAANGTWSLIGPAKKDRRLLDASPLLDSGYIADCSARSAPGGGLCFSADGVTAELIGESSIDLSFTSLNAGGTSKRDIWAPVSKKGDVTLRHYDGTAWTTEKLGTLGSESLRRGVMIPHGASVLLVGSTHALTHEGGCWRRMGHSAPTRQWGRDDFEVLLPNGTFGFSTGAGTDITYNEIIGAFTPR